MKKQRLMVIAAFGCLVIIATLMGCGTLGTDGFLIPAASIEPKFAFVVNGNEEGIAGAISISAYAVNATTGALTAAPSSPFTLATTNNGTLFIDADPTSRFVYAPLGTQNQVAVYSVDQATGKLTQISGSPFNTTGDYAFTAKVDPSGRFLYVASYDPPHVLDSFAVGSDGKLTTIGAPIDLTDYPHIIIMDPQGRFLYVTNEGSTIDGFAINPSTGVLTKITGSPFNTNGDDRGGTTDGNLLFVADRFSDTVTVFTINQSTGALTNVSGTGVATGSGPFTVVEAVAGGKTFAATNNLNDATISVFEVNTSTGALTSVGAAVTLNNFQWPHYMAVDPSGKFGYIVDYGTCCPFSGATITGVTIDATGKLTQVAGSPFTSGGVKAPTQIVISH